MSKLKNALTITVGLAVAVMMVGVASMPQQAEALTADQLSSILETAGVDQNTIDAVVAAMATDTDSDSVDGLTEMNSGMEDNMGPGSTGESVRVLQAWLNDNGYTVAESGPGSPGNESSYYGSLTESAVGEFQDDHGVSYGDYRGYWGPSTREAARAAVGVDDSDSDSDSDSDADPEPDTVSASLSVDEEETEEGESVTLTWESDNAVSCSGDGFDTDEDTAGEVEVTPEEDTTYTVTCEDEDGDTAEASVSVTVVEPTEPDLEGGEGYLDITDMSVSSELIDLGDDTVVYELEAEAMDSDLSIGRMDVRFNDNRPWLYFDEVRLLQDGVEIAALDGTSGNFREIGDDWRGRFTGLDQVIREGETVEFSVEVSTPDSLVSGRENESVGVYVPEEGIRATDGAGFLQYAPEIDLDTTVVDFEEDFGEGELTLTIGDNSPEDKTYIVDDGDKTKDQLLLEFDAKADSSGDINIEDVVIGATGDDLDEFIYRARLFMDGSRVSTVTPDAAEINFDDIDEVVAAGRTSNFEVEVDFKESSGYTTPLEVTVDDTDVTAETQDFTDANESISVGETHTLVEEGLIDSVVGSPSGEAETYRGDSQNKGVYEFEFELHAAGDNFYVPEDYVDAGLDSVGTNITFYSDEANNAEILAVSDVKSSASLTSNDNYRVRDGSTETFTVKVEAVLTSGNEGQLGMTLEGLNYNTDDSTTYGELLELGGRDYESDRATLYTD